MSSALFVLRPGEIRLYLFAILVYMLIASLFVVPFMQQAQTESAVRNDLSQYLTQNSVVSPDSTGTNSVLAAKETPVQLSIDRLNIKLPIKPGYYNPVTRKWTLDNTSVFVDSHTRPNPSVSAKQEHITFIYGHDTPGVLLNTSNLVYGDIMTIDTQNGYRYRYYYNKSKVINPLETSVLSEKNTGDPVVLATCTGVWYQFRRVMYFHLISVQKMPDGPVIKATQ